jgi:nicotinate-nucleotide adenylyltransferase
VRRGILGGSFDPVHVGHLTVAAAAADRLALGVVHFVPAREQPFKAGRHRADIGDRVAMLRAVLGVDARFMLDLREVDREGPSYTVYTLRAITTEYPADALFLLVGADAARDLPEWREAQEMREFATVAVLTRPGTQLPSGDVVDEVVEVPIVNVSSSLVRERVARGESIQGLVPEVVAEYIEQHGLYRTKA